VDADFWHQALRNTLDGIYHLAQAARPYLRGGGAIVTIAASFSVRQEGNPAYGAAKGAITGLSQSLAKEFYEDEIRVNCIGSGLIRAQLAGGPVRPVTGLARTGRPEDIAFAALYLASDEAGWVTGQVLNVDGGVDVGTRPLWQFEK
jgi:NAD(P)-dependent dehydrogenase (short-subunit alcohol dehydrogenase family)